MQYNLLYTKENIEVEERAAFSTYFSKPQLSFTKKRKKNQKLQIENDNG